MTHLISAKPFIIFASVFLVCAIAAPGIYYFRQYQHLKKQMDTKIPQESVQDLVAKVAKHVLLPSDETPTVLSVTDREKLSGQAFFANAANGDQVLIFEKAKKAFLYSTDRDIVLEIGPVNFGSTASAQPVATTPGISVTPTPSTGNTPVTVPLGELRFFLLNGTSVNGLTRRYESTLKKYYPDAVIVDRDSAKSSEYSQSLIIDVSGTKDAQTKELAKMLGLTVSPLPAGELTSANADFLIILGEDNVTE